MILKNTLTEYSRDNNLNLTERQINELSIYNAGPGASIYDNYLNNNAKAHETTYEEERTLFNERIGKLISTKN